MRDYREQTIPKECRDNFAYTLSRIRWDVFGSLTFKGCVPRPPVAKAHAWRLLRHAAKVSQRPYSQLLIALREELGETNGRYHLHFLLGGTHTRNAITLSFQLKHQWRGQTGAMSIIRPFDHSQAGVAYVTKCLSGGDVYEMNKFISADEVTLSSSVYRVIRSQERMRKDTRLALVKKRAAVEAAAGPLRLQTSPA